MTGFEQSSRRDGILIREVVSDKCSVRLVHSVERNHIQT